MEIEFQSTNNILSGQLKLLEKKKKNVNDVPEFNLYFL